MTPSPRDVSLDLLRVTAIAMVVLMHSPIAGSAPGAVLATLSYLTAPCIGLLFMVSGALLLGNQSVASDFLRRRFGKIVVPTLFWTVFYLGVRYVNTPPPQRVAASRDYLHTILGARAWRAVVYVHPCRTLPPHSHLVALAQAGFGRRGEALPLFVGGHAHFPLFEMLAQHQ